MWIVVNGGGSKVAGPFDDDGTEAAEIAESWNQFWGTTDYRPRKLREPLD